jgi:hypothetical protein
MLGFLLAKTPTLVLQCRPLECHSAHGETATWDETGVPIEAAYSDSSHRRQMSGNIEEGVNHFTAWWVIRCDQPANAITASNVRAELDDVTADRADRELGTN